MPNRTAHAWGAGITVATTTAYHELKEGGKLTWKTPAAGLAAGAIGSLPDILEPAMNPNHRQFFHSWIVFGLIGYLTYKTYKWEPKTNGKKWLRLALLIAEVAYMVHLIMDATTKKSLPILGKL